MKLILTPRYGLCFAIFFLIHDLASLFLKIILTHLTCAEANCGGSSGTRGSKHREMTKIKRLQRSTRAQMSPDFFIFQSPSESMDIGSSLCYSACQFYDFGKPSSPGTV
jgi:hypothetical protein